MFAGKQPLVEVQGLNSGSKQVQDASLSVEKDHTSDVLQEGTLRGFQEHTGERPLAMGRCVNFESKHVHNTNLPVVQEQAIEEFQESALGGTAEHTEREQPLFKSRGVSSERKRVRDAIVPVVQGKTKNFQKVFTEAFQTTQENGHWLRARAGIPKVSMCVAKVGLLCNARLSRILIKVPLKALGSTREEGRSWFRSRVRTVSEDFLAKISWLG